MRHKARSTDIGPDWSFGPWDRKSALPRLVIAPVVGKQSMAGGSDCFGRKIERSIERVRNRTSPRAPAASLDRRAARVGLQSAPRRSMTLSTLRAVQAPPQAVAT